MKSKVLSFDYSLPPHEVIDSIASAVAEFDSPEVIQVADTGGDNYVAIIAERPLSSKQAQKIYDEWMRIA